MATAAQIEANRQNAKKSTGPKSTEGKYNSATNSKKFGLFSAINVVHADEREEYDAMSDGLFTQLNPDGALEEMIVTDIVRCAWRLRRCVAAEEDLANWVLKREERTALTNGREPERTDDIDCYSNLAGLNTAIERARAQAISSRRRLLADLEKIQNERFLRTELLNAKLLDQRAEILESPTGSVRKVLTDFRALRALVNKNPEESARLEMAHICNESNQLLAQARQNAERKKQQNEADPTPAPEIPATNLTQSTPRNAPCPCQSGQKFKRCCGQDAPPVLHAAA